MNKCIQRFCLLLSGAFVLGTLPQSLISATPATATNLVTNGSFEDPIVTNISNWNHYDSIPGWSLSQGSKIEVQRSVNGVGSPADGFQHVELDSNTSSSIFQDLVTQMGQSYLLKFAFSPRPGINAQNNNLGVKWDGALIDQLTADGTELTDSAWTYFTYTLTARKNRTRLEFVDLGYSNAYGTYLDDVSVQAVPESGSLLGVLVFGAFGARAVLKRKY